MVSLGQNELTEPHPFLATDNLINFQFAAVWIKQFHQKLLSMQLAIRNIDVIGIMKLKAG